MNIIEKIIQKKSNRSEANSVTIVALGDSVTEGCFECFFNESGNIDTVFERRSSYSSRLEEMLALIYPKVQINVVNSGFSGARARYGAKFIERDVLKFSPDLVIVSYGLNDCGGGMEGLSEYEESLNAIFEKIKKSGAEVIFLTQNYMCTKVSPHLTDESMKELAKKFSSRQSSGILDLYYDKAKELCRKHNVEVCDLYAVWKAMDKSGVDVTELLANKLNHPIREYHYYIAIKLIEKILGV